MSTLITRWCVSRGVTVAESSVGPFVLHTDHLASHAVYEAVERAAFELELIKYDYCVRRDDYGDYINGPTHLKWQGWLACAKSRAKRAGGAE
jgi:hypothetical protein